MQAFLQPVAYLLAESEVLGEIEQGVNKIEQGVHQIATKLGVQLSDSDDQATNADKITSSTPDAEANARVTLHEIRRALNEFRDNQRLGIVSIRNQLMASIFVTGFVTYALLCTVVLALLHANNARATRANCYPGCRSVLHCWCNGWSFW